VLKHVPKNPAQVEFVSYVTWIDRQTFLANRIEYTNTSGKLYRRVEALETREIDGYPTVVSSRTSDLTNGGYTDMRFRYIAYDLGMPAAVFTQRSLRNPPRQWLKRPDAE
jgi:hypothetical protein